MTKLNLMKPILAAVCTALFSFSLSAQVVKNDRLLSFAYKVKSRPYDLLFPAPLRCGSGVQSARSKRINAHGTPPFPFHFPF